MIEFKQDGDFSKLNNYLERLKGIIKLSNLDKYGRKGVEALRLATPKDSTKTAESWSYEIDRTRNGVTLSFLNSNINDGVSIAIILQYGHGTRNGGWVEGVDYINPALRPIFDEIANDAWKEVRKL